MLKRILLTITTTTCLASSALAQTPPASSAYAGAVGDWALGRWLGYRYLDAAYTRMTSEDRVLVVAKGPNGNVGCQWSTPAGLAKAGWAPCVIDATTIVITPAAGTRVELNREGAELAGRDYDQSTARNRIHLHRE